MRRWTVLSALALAASAAPLHATAAPRGLDVRDLVTMDRVSDPQASPDGTRIAFVLRETDLAANKGVFGIWLVPARGGEAQRVTAKGATANNPRWSNDGKSLYFLSTRSGSQQIWRLDLGGGEAHQVSDYPVDVGSFKLAPVGRQLAFTLEVFTDCDTLACTKKRRDEAAANKSSGKTFDKLFIRHWDAWADGRRSQLYTAEPDAEGRLAAEPKRVSNGIDGDIPSKPHGDDSEYSWSPDGKRLAFGARIAGRTEPWSTNFDLFVAPPTAPRSPTT
jgi:dipeptidyl aminopeptidase/acylaminoacyl peptidase